jgi:hypothetical protein
VNRESVLKIACTWMHLAKRGGEGNDAGVATSMHVMMPSRGKVNGNKRGKVNGNKRGELNGNKMMMRRVQIMKCSVVRTHV